MTTNETIDCLQEIIDRNQKTILPRVHIGYLIHAVKYLKEQKEEIENLKQTAQSMMEGAYLLKEQEVKTHGADSGMCEICSFYARAMSVKPHYNAHTNWYECGACHYSMTSGMHCRNELIPAYKVGFCAKCGKAVKWNECNGL